jgi:RNA polymerase sigma-70 factor (ECF subfamily)
LAIGELIERHQADLRLYCYLMLGCPVKAAAAVRETVAQAHHGLPDAAAAPSERTWLYRIATRACVQGLERKR